MEKRRNGAIDFLKFVFSVMIVLYHGRNLGNPENPIFRSGKVAVEFFFIVSGYLMAAKAEQISCRENLRIGEETSSFILGKIKTLLPHTLLAFVIGYSAAMFLSANPIAYVKKLPYSIWEVSFLWMSGLGEEWINGQTWYLSSMLLVMLVLYPIAIKNFDVFSKVVAPAVGVLVLGWIAKEQGFLATYKNDAWTGTVYNGNLRALSEICIGTISYELAKVLSKMNFTKLGSVLVALTEWGLYLTVIIWGGNSRSYGKLFVSVFLLCVAIALTFSEKGFFSNWFNKKPFYWLGNFSFILYLNHITAGAILKKVIPDQPYCIMIVMFVVFSFALSFVCYFIGLLMRKHGMRLLLRFQKKLFT